MSQRLQSRTMLRIQLPKDEVYNQTMTTTTCMENGNPRYLLFGFFGPVSSGDPSSRTVYFLGFGLCGEYMKSG